MTISRLFLYMGFLCLAACGGGGGGGGSGGGSSSSSSSSGGNADTTAPTLQLIFPPPGQTYLALSDFIALHGTASDNIGVAQIQGIELGALGAGAWSGRDSLLPGLNTLSIRALDTAGNSSTAAGVSVINDGVFSFHPESLMFDRDRNRLLMVDRLKDHLMEQDLSSIYRKTISFNNSPVKIRGFAVYRPSENQVYFLDDITSLELKRLDLDDGSIVTISNLHDDMTGPILVAPAGMTYDPEGNDVYVMKHDGTIMRVDGDTGNRSIIASSSIGTGDDFMNLMAITWDSNAKGLLALDQDVNGELYAVNATTGARTLISRNGTRGLGPNFTLASVSALAYDFLQNRALFVAQNDSQRYSLFSVDLANGDRMFASDNVEAGLGTLISPGDTMPLAVDFLGRKAYLTTDNLYAPMEIDLQFGRRRLLASEVGTGTGTATKLTDPRRGRFDRVNNRLLITDGNQKALFIVDARSGNRALISGSGAGATAGAGPALTEPVAVDINAAATTAYVLDAAADAIFSVDLSTGGRSLIFSNATSTGGTLNSAVDMVFDEDNNRLLVVDLGANALAEVTLSGQMSYLLQDLAAAPDANNGQGPVAIEIDRTTDRAFIVVNEFIATGPAMGVIVSEIVELNLANNSTREFVGFNTNEVLVYHDLAMGFNGNTLYAMDSESWKVYQINATTGEVLRPDAIADHSFVFHEMSAIETGIQDKTVYMFDARAGAVMLVEINPIESSAGDSIFQYKGVILSQ